MTTNSTRSYSDDPATDYARAVVAGEIPAGQRVISACQRHLDDLVRPDFPYYFDPAEAQKKYDFFGYLHHYKGKGFAGQAFELEPWQKFIIGCVFGWKREADNLRRFRIAFVMIPRKNGKSTLGAGVALLLLLADREPGAEVYSAATKRDQAKIVFDAAKKMVERSPALRQRVKAYKNSLAVEATDSFFTALASDSKSLDGLNVHGSVIDEVHAHKSPAVIDLLEDGMASRDQPLQFEITTAGEFSNTSICFLHYEYTERVLSREFEDEAAEEWFGYIATVDDVEKWDDPAEWAKANPNLGVSVTLDALQARCQKALAIPAQKTNFQIKRLNIWAQAADRAIDMRQWKRGAKPIDVEALRDRPCFMGLDLAKVNDLSALAILFPPTILDEPWRVLMKFYCPEVDIAVRTKEHRVPYELWRERGLLTATPGSSTDFKYIQSDIIDLAGQYRLEEISYDRTFAHELVTNLSEELGRDRVVGFGQGFISMGNATAAVDRWITDGKLQHGGNRILNWCASNVVYAVDPAGNNKPDKSKAREKIDGMVALYNAAGRAVLGNREESYLNSMELVVV